MLEMNRVIDRIEERIDAEIDVSRVAREELTSEHHLRRMFMTLSGISLADYVRRRKMTVATADILAGTPLIDVALRYGYGSAEAFSRAFRRFHGVTPSDARSRGVGLTSQPKLRFQITVKGVTNMDYRIENKDAFYLTGFRTRVPLVYLGENSAMVEFERGLDPTATDALAALSNTEPRGTLGVTTNIDDPREEGSLLDYWHAVATTEVVDGFEQELVPAGTWVVFTTEGPFPEALQQMWADAATDWFPSNPWLWAPGPELLSITYGEDDTTGDVVCGELWIPVEPAGDAGVVKQ